MPISAAISVSSAGRPLRCSSLWTQASIARAWRRTLRGSQSRLRNSSIIAPRMRWLAKVAKLAPAFGSKRPIASSRPSVPAWIRSSSSTPDGSFTCKASAWRRTAGRCCFSNSFWSIFPCAVYILGRGQERLGFADIIVTWAHYGRVRGSGCRDKAPIPAAFWVIEIARRASSSVVHQQLDGAHLHGRAFPPRQTETELQRRAGGLAGQRIAGTTTPLHRHAAPVHAQFGSEGAAGRQRN